MPSSIGSSSSAIFGVGLSVFSLSSDCSDNTYEDIDDDLDLSLFEGSSAGGTVRTHSPIFEDEEIQVRHKTRNSITQILNGPKRPSRKKRAAPKAPKNIGHRSRPKLGNVAWQTEEEEGEGLIEVSSRDFILTPNKSHREEEEDEFGYIQIKKKQLFKEEQIVQTDDLDVDLEMFTLTPDEPLASAGGQGLL